MEVRNFDIEIRAETLDIDNNLKGYAAIFDSPSKPLMGKNGTMFIEVIRSGAFTESLNNPDILALFNHKTDYVLGRVGANTLSLQEDKNGLAVDIIPPNTTIGNDTVISVKRGDIRKMSIGFTVEKERWTRDENGNPLREILKLTLYEVSLVAVPAYDATSIFVRSNELIEVPNVEIDRLQSPTNSTRARYKTRFLSLTGKK